MPPNAHILEAIVLVPLLATAIILLGSPARVTAICAVALDLALALLAFCVYDRAGGGLQFCRAYDAPAPGAFQYLIGADGLSLVLVLLAATVAFCAVVAAPPSDDRPRLYYSMLLLICGGALGAFVAQDLLSLYAFHELALVPTFLLIGIWGTGERQRAAWRITLYLGLASFVLLIGLICLYLALPDGTRTISLSSLQALAARHPIPAAEQPWLFGILLVGFGTLVGLFPLHTWAPAAYACAPYPVAMLHAGVLKKFGVYGLLRVAIPLLPEGARAWAGILLALLLGNILYVGLAAIAQRRLDRMLGYSSVMHMGILFLGILCAEPAARGGAALLMFAHGLSIAALFLVAGYAGRRCGTLELARLGGLSRVMPSLGLAFGVAAFASIGLPGFGNFVAELMIFIGAFRLSALVEHAWMRPGVALALLGILLSAVYTLRAYRQAFLGEIGPGVDLVRAERVPARILLPAILLLGALLLAGLWPGLFLDALAASRLPQLLTP